ncbi:FAD-binding oxidoreductase [Thalassotalea nanhaiensis]|uniref:FAD-binding oxidoreductase n=1 Tax=Thalassotalea nanhaiensis TaxID=3065648 RepID=A0ABY9TJJ6_9GAMM|nr:FAD-binding oxidoreductase [Colwelliaceae bacterium SQ345]
MFGLKKTVQETEHTSSYYAATANDKTVYQKLEGEIKTDVVVVGGGFSGVNTALELAEKGYAVVLLEAKRIAWGATGRNGGQIIAGIGSPAKFERTIGKSGVNAIYEMGFEASEVIRERVAKYNIDCDLKWGYCDVAIKPRHMKELEQWQAQTKKDGNPHQLQMLDQHEVKQFVNSDNYIGGLFNPTGNGHVHPLNLCAGEAHAASELGVQIFEQSKVTNIEHGSRVKVHTDCGKVDAKFLVLCGNAYMGELVPKLATKILPSNSSVIATAPLPSEIVNAIMPADVAVCDPRTALDYFRLSADKRLLFGGLSNYTGLEPTDLKATMAKKMLKVFPELAGIDIDYGWSGQMGIGLNRMPQLGNLADNIFYVQAYSGHGVAPTHMMARVIAEAIDGKPERFNILAKIHHWSFPGGKLFRRPALAIGMMYYKILDEL